MMISPEMFVEQYQDKSYAELLELRDELIGYIKEFEEAEGEMEVTMYPTPQSVSCVSLSLKSTIRNTFGMMKSDGC